jgi:hypothetical protein
MFSLAKYFATDLEAFSNALLSSCLFDKVNPASAKIPLQSIFDPPGSGGDTRILEQFFLKVLVNKSR